MPSKTQDTEVKMHEVNLDTIQAQTSTTKKIGDSISLLFSMTNFSANKCYEAGKFLVETFSDENLDRLEDKVKELEEETEPNEARIKNYQALIESLTWLMAESDNIRVTNVPARIGKGASMKEKKLSFSFSDILESASRIVEINVNEAWLEELVNPTVEKAVSVEAVQPVNLGIFGGAVAE